MAPVGALMVTLGGVAAEYPDPPLSTYMPPNDPLAARDMDPLNGAQVAVVAAVKPEIGAPHVYPHIGTTVPSGMVMVVGPAVRLTAWPKLIATAQRRSVIITDAAFNVAF